MRKIAGLRLVLPALLACVLSSAVHAQRVDPDIRMLRAILETPEEKIDLARAKLSVDRIIDPGTDIEATLKKIDAMAAAVRAASGPQATSTEIAQRLRSYLYDAGPWNDGRPFRYDLEGDPLGRSIPNKLLANHLRTRKGNCVSMPALFVILGQRLGLNATFAHSPNHFFVKFRDETGRWINLETTSGGNPRRDELFQQDTPMSPQALKNGLYMRPLSKRQAVVEPIMDVLFTTYSAGPPEKLMALADLVLEFEPQSVNAMLLKGQAYSLFLVRDFERKYPRPKDIPAEERSRYIELQRNNHAWFQKAEALGWREPEPDADAKYLNARNR